MMPKRHIALLLFAALLTRFDAAYAQESVLLVQLQGIRDEQGDVRVLLFADPATFPKEDKALRSTSLPARSGQISIRFDALPPGQYAIMAYHDENADQRLNRRFGMFPTEGYGLSNHPKVMGPPRFADSAFEVAGPETAIDIRITY